MTMSAILGAVLGIAVLVFLPPGARLGLSSTRAAGCSTAPAWRCWSVFVACRSPCCIAWPVARAPPAPRITPGSLLATVLWLVASGLLDFYVDHFGTFAATYGPLGAVVGVMMWFFVSVYAVLLGAELNAQLEGGRAGRPRGRRGRRCPLSSGPRDQGKMAGQGRARWHEGYVTDMAYTSNVYREPRPPGSP